MLSIKLKPILITKCITSKKSIKSQIREIKFRFHLLCAFPRVIIIQLRFPIPSKFRMMYWKPRYSKKCLEAKCYAQFNISSSIFNMYVNTYIMNHGSWGTDFVYILNSAIINWFLTRRKDTFLLLNIGKLLKW